VLPLQELLGAAEAGGALQGGRRGGAGRRADEEGGGGGDADDGDTASLWSSASSVVSGAGGAGGGGWGGESVSSGASESSGRSSASSRAGLFSHLSATSTGQRLVESRSLRLSGEGMTRREAASLDHEAALRTVHRRETRGAQQQSRARRSATAPAAPRKRRPARLTFDRCCLRQRVQWPPTLRRSAAHLVQFGCGGAADALLQAFNSWIDEVKALALPAPKRNAAAELRALQGGEGIGAVRADDTSASAAAASDASAGEAVTTAVHVEHLIAGVRALQLL